MKFAVATAITVLGLSLTFLNSMTQTTSYGDKLKRIAEEVNSSNTTWKAAHYQNFSGFSKSTLKGYSGLKASEILTADTNNLDSGPNKLQITLPKNFDSRERWPKCSSIREILDQTKCASCWAMSSAGTISDRICIHSNQENQTRVSAEDLLECCHECGNGCQGGGMFAAYNYWKDTGIVTGGLHGDQNSCKPYQFAPCNNPGAKQVKYPVCPRGMYSTPKCVKKCQDSYPFAYESNKIYAESVYVVRGEEEIAAEIMKNGPVTGGLWLYEDLFSYKSGIYEHLVGENLGGHAIRIIGFGEEAGVKFWTIANSWNENWGEDGYFRIVRGKNECGIEGSVVTGIPKL